MRICLQRCSRAQVSVEGDKKSSINKGFLILLGIEKEDSIDQINKLTQKIVDLRVFDDEDGKMNRSIIDVKGEVLLVSQFTLAASTKKGRRPSFDCAAEPAKAEEFYLLFAEKLREKSITTKTGIFGAIMEVELVNDGPVTFILSE